MEYFLKMNWVLNEIRMLKMLQRLYLYYEHAVTGKLTTELEARLSVKLPC